MKWKLVAALGFCVAVVATYLPGQAIQEVTQRSLLMQELSTPHSNAPTPPGSVENPPSHSDLAYFAWRLFVWANQGTNATLQDGRPRETASTSFLDAGESPLFNGGTNPLIFEGLYHRTEAYPYFTRTAPPQSPIRQVPIYRFAAGDSIPPFTVPAGKGQYVNLDETNQIGQNFLYYRRSNDPDFPVLYMAKVNAAEVNYAWGRKLVPRKSTSWVFPDGVIEIKAAWRRVEDINIMNSDPDTYHQARATYYVGKEGDPPSVETGDFALIALHIIQKSAGYQSFIFTTFEHVNAVTRNASGSIIDPAYQLTYDTLAYDPGDPTTATPLGAYYSNEAGQSDSMNSLATYTLPAGGAQGAQPPDGYNIVLQPKTITSFVNDVNNLVAPMLGETVWRNYRLKGVQAVPTSDDTRLDYYLANIVVESSQPGIQLFRGGVADTGKKKFTNKRAVGNISNNLTYNDPVPQPQFTMGGCMGCHGGAQQVGGDFSFLADSAGRGKPVDPVPPSALTPAERMAHNRAVAARRALLFRRQN